MATAGDVWWRAMYIYIQNLQFMYRNREELYFDIVCGALDKTTDSSIDSNSKFTGKIQVVSQESHGSNVYCDSKLVSSL